MKTLAKKINIYKGGVDIINNDNLNRKIFNIILVSFGVLGLCYTIFLANTVFNVVARQSLARESKLLSNDVGSLELEYLSISNKVDMELAKSLGFKEDNSKKYAVRKSLTALKLAKNEI